MAKTQSIKRRIKSVGNTKQITKAMELVSAVKMRRSQTATLSARPYSHAAEVVLAELATVVPSDHPLFVARPIKQRLIIIFSSDRGLAGSYISNLLKIFLASLTNDPTPAKCIIVGEKVAQFARRLSNVELIGVYANWPTEPSPMDLRPISETALRLYLRGEVDQVQLLYTDFISTIKQQVVLRNLLPVTDPKRNMSVAKEIEDVRFEPTSQEILEAIVPQFLKAQLYQAQLEALASEHSMRMVAMKNATDNATDLIDDLTLTFNSARQAAITQELAEITSGAEAMKG